MTAAPDEILPLYRAIKLVGVLAIVIFAAGIVEFISFEPPGQSTGAVARITGIYAYDPVAKTFSGPPAERFPRSQPFAAVVDWSSIPAGTQVAARWFNSFGEVVGQAGPAPPRRSATRRCRSPCRPGCGRTSRAPTSSSSSGSPADSRSRCSPAA